jgi:beta-glucosidase
VEAAAAVAALAVAGLPAAATGAGTATAGADYTATSGTLTFPAGTASGASRTVTVAAGADKTAETAETVPVAVTSSTAGVDTAKAAATVVIDANGLPYLDSRLPVAARVRDLMSRMTLAEKVGQMTQGERPAFADDPSLIAANLLGSVLSGGGSVPTPNTPEAWADMVDSFQAAALTTRLQIPILYGVDTVHGHGNLVGATIFPHNIGLGSTRDPGLVEDVEHVAANETRATGPQWAFAPCICVARDTRWGRTYESFGEDPSLVIAMETAIDGFQGPRASQLARPDRVLATAKHYAGDGLTTFGTGSGDFSIDQGIDEVSRADFDRLALAPYVPAVQQHRAGTVMPSYSSVDFTDDGLGNPVKMHAQQDLITNVLKGQIGFDGFVISDYNGIDQLPGDFADHVRTAVNAGIDMFMQPANFAQYEATLLDEVNAGRVSTARIDDAVSRILTKKFEMGLFERPFTPRRNMDQIGSAAHRAVARKAVAESQVLLRNDGDVLPLKKNTKVYVAGRNADDIGNQAGGWTVAWQGISGDGVIPGTTVLDGIRKVDPNVTFRRTDRPRPPARTSASSSSARRRTRRASATSADRRATSARRSSWSRSRSRSTRPTPRPWTRSAPRSPSAWCWSCPGGRRCSTPARSTRSSRPGCPAARATASRTCCSGRSRSPGGCRRPGRPAPTRSRSTSATRPTHRPSRTAGGCGPTRRGPGCRRPEPRSAPATRRCARPGRTSPRR